MPRQLRKQCFLSHLMDVRRSRKCRTESGFQNIFAATADITYGSTAVCSLFLCPKAGTRQQCSSKERGWGEVHEVGREVVTALQALQRGPRAPIKLTAPNATQRPRSVYYTSAQKIFCEGCFPAKMQLGEGCKNAEALDGSRGLCAQLSC